MTYTPPQIDTDPDAITVRILDGMTDSIPGWVPVEGTAEVVLAEEIGRETAVTAQTAVDSLNTAFAAFGETVFGVAVEVAAAASVTVSVTVVASGSVIPAGFAVRGTNPDGVDVEFKLDTPVTASSTSATFVMTAAVAGTVGNGVPAGPVTITTATATVVTATVTVPSDGGVDDEPIGDYLDRLVDYTSTLRPGGVRAADVAALARNVPGVDRVLALDLYDPSTPSTPQERTVTVVPIDADNAAVSTGIRDDVLALLEETREVNFRFFATTPTFTDLTITYTAVAETGADPGLVSAAIAAAVGTWLAGWGSTPDDPKAWIKTPTVRYLELAQVAGSAAGVAYLSALTLNGGSSNVTLSGAAPLPSPLGAGSTITGTVA